MSEPTAILFDMDGTLVDSDAVVERAWRDWARRHGLDAGHVLDFAHGNVAARTVRHLAPHLSEAEVVLGDVVQARWLPCGCREAKVDCRARAAAATFRDERPVLARARWSH